MNSLDFSPILKEALALRETTRSLRRDFHRHPELGFQEVRTAEIIASELHKLGIETSTGIAETGVVGIIEGRKAGPVVLLRFDMDALPVNEETGAEYASMSPGLMHACGHDGHVAVGLTVARLLHDCRHSFAGTVKLVFQPAEEGMGGAERMVAEGVLEHPRPDHALGLHLWNEKPLGWIGITSGPVMAGADILSIKVTGRGGHAAMPQFSADPVAAAAQIISALQMVVSRNVSPLETAVVSVTRVRAGETFNVIPSDADLLGTIRYFNEQVHRHVVRRVEEIAGGIAAAMGCSAQVKIEKLTPAVVNDAAAAEKVSHAAEGLFPGAIIDREYRTMGSEDMAYILERAPGCYFMLGSANSARGLDYGHHHPKFDFDEDVLPRASALMAQAAMEFLK